MVIKINTKIGQIELEIDDLKKLLNEDVSEEKTAVYKQEKKEYKAKRYNKMWTAEEVQRLKQEYHDGLSKKQKSRVLNRLSKDFGRTRQAIMCQNTKMGLGSEIIKKEEQLPLKVRNKYNITEADRKRRVEVTRLAHAIVKKEGITYKEAINKAILIYNYNKVI